MDEYDIGKYTYQISQNRHFYFTTSSGSAHRSDLVDSVKSYDLMLHHSLEKIFRKRFHSNSDRVNEFLRGSQHNTDYNSIIEPILKQEPSLSKHFSKEELGKLSLLWIAVLGCYDKSAELLVRSGADVKELFGRRDPQVIDEKWTVLQVLLQKEPSPKNERLIRLVTDQGADLQARDCRGHSVLHIALTGYPTGFIIQGQSRVKGVKMLLERGADVNAADNSENTPLLVAAGHREANELLPLLIKHGADIFAKNRGGQNVLHCLATATTKHNVDQVRALIEMGVSLDDRELFSDYLPIHQAAMQQHNELIELYLDCGANVNALTRSGKSPLHVAAEWLNDTEVESLLKCGANVHLRTTEGRTALHAACEGAADTSDNEDGEFEKIIRLLLSAGADVLVKDYAGQTPLALISSRVDRRQPGDESWPLIEALALKKALQPSIELKDKEIIERYPAMRNYFQICTKEIDRLKSTRFIKTCSVFELLAKSPCQVAALMRNPEFETQFRLYCRNKGLSMYAEDIVAAFERAQDHYRSLLEQANVINEAVYNILPYLVVEKMVHYILNCC